MEDVAVAAVFVDLGCHWLNLAIGIFFIDFVVG